MPPVHELTDVIDAVVRRHVPEAPEHKSFASTITSMSMLTMLAGERAVDVNVTYDSGLAADQATTAVLKALEEALLRPQSGWRPGARRGLGEDARRFHVSLRGMADVPPPIYATPSNFSEGPPRMAKLFPDKPITPWRLPSTTSARKAFPCCRSPSMARATRAPARLAASPARVRAPG